MKRFLIFLGVLIILAGAGYWRYQQPLPSLHGRSISLSQPPAVAVKLPWPAYGQAALGASGYGILAEHKASKPVPIASIAKTITALAILKERPIQLGQPSPLLTITQADEQSFRDYLAKDGSVVPIKAGQKISEYQALQAMMLPSANNIADTTARWAFGSVDNYVNYANQFVKSLGMAQTHVADASGFSPRTTSTAKDLVILGEAALQNPTLAGIVNQPGAKFPGIDEKIRNVNWLLGTEGILGIKTGNTDEAGGCYLFAAKRPVRGQYITVVGAILGAPQRTSAMDDSLALIKAADRGFRLITVARTGQSVGRYDLPWGGQADAVAGKDVSVLNWKAKKISLDVDMNDLKTTTSKGTPLGSLTVSGHDEPVPIVLKQAPAEPSWTWRLLR